MIEDQSKKLNNANADIQSLEASLAMANTNIKDLQQQIR
jgi:hypothetical protein